MPTLMPVNYSTSAVHPHTLEKSGQNSTLVIGAEGVMETFSDPSKMHKCAILSQHGDEIFTRELQKLTRDKERRMTQRHASTFDETLVFAAWLISDLPFLFSGHPYCVSVPCGVRGLFPSRLGPDTNTAYSFVVRIVSRRNKHQILIARNAPSGDNGITRSLRSRRSQRAFIETGAPKVDIWTCAGLEVSPVAPVSDPGPHPALVAWRQKQSIQEARPDAINGRRNCVSCGPGEGHPRHSPG